MEVKPSAILNVPKILRSRQTTDFRPPKHTILIYYLIFEAENPNVPLIIATLAKLARKVEQYNPLKSFAIIGFVPLFLMFLKTHSAALLVMIL